METLLMVGFIAALVGLISSIAVLYKLITTKKTHRLDY